MLKGGAARILAPEGRQNGAAKGPGESLAFPWPFRRAGRPYGRLRAAPPHKERASFSLNAVFFFNGHVNFAEGISRILLKAVFGIYL